MIGKTVKVIVDRPKGSFHPQYKDIIYPLNYGYVEGVLAKDGEEQDVYVMVLDRSTMNFEGEVIAIIHRMNDVEDKWVVSPKGVSFTKKEFIEATGFQEKFFDIDVIV